MRYLIEKRSSLDPQPSLPPSLLTYQHLHLEPHAILQKKLPDLFHMISRHLSLYRQQQLEQALRRTSPPSFLPTLPPSFGMPLGKGGVELEGVPV
jgi:hypothetical protein